MFWQPARQRQRPKRHGVTQAKPGAATSDSWLAGEVSAGRVDTVALSFADRLGAWRGKSVPAREFVEHGPVVLGFCDGMVVCDIRCGVIEETPFSNFSTGYPDLHVTLDPRDACPTGWRPGEAYVFGVPSDHHGVALEVAPTAVLTSVVSRFEGSVPVRRAPMRALPVWRLLAAPSFPGRSSTGTAGHLSPLSRMSAAVRGTRVSRAICRGVFWTLSSARGFPLAT